MCAEQNKENLFQDICDFPTPTYEEWKQAVEKSLKGAPFSKLLTKTYEGIVLEPMYQRKDIENLSFPKTMPGQFPFLRGTKQVDESNGWVVAQEMSHPIPETVNEWLKSDLPKGVNAIHIALAEETKLGLPYSVNNRCGTSIASIDDIEAILKDIDVTNYPILIQAGSTAIPLVSLIASYYSKNELPLSELKGCIGADPLAMLVKAGKLPHYIDSYLNQMAELVKWAEENSPNLKTIFIDSHSYHDSGSNGIQELAFMIATGVYYIRELQERGLSVDQITSALQFSISIGSNLFMELAKIRALKMLWANIIKEFGGKEEAQKITIHARTSRWTKTVYDPYVNILRSTVEAFTAAVGGIDSLHVSSFDEAFTLPNGFSRRIARNIQLILQEEAQVSRTIDPAGGSAYVEHVTAEVAKKSWELFQTVEEQGGMLQALQNGMPQKLVKEVAEQKKKDIEKRKLIFVGATMYPNSTEKISVSNDSALKVSLEQRLGNLKNKGINECSIHLVIEDALKAAQNGATVEQLMAALGNGDSITVDKLEQFRATEAFELLRKFSEQKKEQGNPVQVFLTSIGALSEHKPRTDFIASFFETGGFDIEKNNGYTNIDEAIEATIATNAETAVICGTNASYNEFAIKIASEVKRRRPDLKLFIAGKQESELEQSLLRSGVDGFIHVGTNCYQLLNDLQKGGVVHD